MPLFGRIKSAVADSYGALTRVVGGLWTRYGGQGWAKVRLLLPSARFDWEHEAGDVWSNSVVALAISWLGDRFPRARLVVSKIARNGDHVPQGRHGALDLWNRPNPHYDRRTLEKACGLSLKTDGNCYIYKVRDRGGRVCELWWLPHFRVLPTWPPDGSQYIDGYTVWLDVGRFHLPVEDVIHIRDGIDPRNERLGLAAVRAQIREVVTVNLESSYTGALLKNMAVPSLAIVPDSEALRPDKPDAERIKESFTENFAGDNAGGVTVLAGKYKIVEVGLSPEKLMLDKLPDKAISRIAAAIGVAPMSMGLADPGKTYANLAEANKTSWGTVVGVQELLADGLRWQLLPEAIQVGGVVTAGTDPHAYLFEYDYSQVQELQESLDAVHARTREDFKADLVTKNEARELLGFEPDNTAGDVYFSEIQGDAGTELDAEGEGEEGHVEGKKPKGRVDVQQTALNGAQIASLVQIVEAIGLDQIPAESARAMVAASFPSLDPALIEQIIGPASRHTPPEPEPVVVAAPGGNGKPPDEPPGGKALSFAGRNGCVAK